MNNTHQLKSMVILSSILSVGTLSARAGISTVATFPGTMGPSGSIEFEMKLVGYGAGDTIGVGGDPNMFGGVTGPGFGGFGIAGMSFNANNGGGSSGLTGILTPLQPGGTHGSAGSGQATFGDVLGTQASVDGWHLYRVDWNQGGLANGDAADGHQVAVYLDGTLNSNNFIDSAPSFVSAAVNIAIGYTGGASHPSQSIVFDDLKVWDGSKTLVLANSFENSSLICSTGPDGTYISGNFVPGFTGNGLQTVVPEPAEYLAVSAFGLAAFAAFRRRVKD